MVFSTVQLVIGISIITLIVAGIVFIIQDTRAHRRRESAYSRKSSRTISTFEHEHEPA